MSYGTAFQSEQFQSNFRAVEQWWNNRYFDFLSMKVGAQHESPVPTCEIEKRLNSVTFPQRWSGSVSKCCWCTWCTTWRSTWLPPIEPMACGAISTTTGAIWSFKTSSAVSTRPGGSTSSPRGEEATTSSSTTAIDQKTGSHSSTHFVDVSHVTATWPAISSSISVALINQTLGILAFIELRDLIQFIGPC